ncbi:hypothetical protein HPB47_024642 [Ixodes persulcatus]|uniref:Uncharacterized protein n=1 Tax=Ixodes persulcatus TaxID=34615 RepID=A0AC60Q606_IXOPE|nr:hypothetical protein HPB47_024642 [Ixodes persulcatus]
MSRSSDDSNHETSNEDNVDTRKIECKHAGCKYRTNRSSNMARHVKGKHGDLLTPRICCGQEFRNRFAVDTHRDQVHRRDGSGPLTYVCMECAKIFYRQCLLARHMCVHTGETPFKCHVCTYATSHKSNLTRHQAAKHGIVKAKPQDPSSDDEESSSDEDSGIGSGNSDRSDRPASAGSGKDVAKQRGSTKAGPKRTPLKRQVPRRPAKNRIWIPKISEQHMKDAVKTAQPVTLRKFSSAYWNISARDLREAGPSGVQVGGPSEQGLGTHTPNDLVSETESPPTIWDDVDDLTWDAAMGLLMLSGPFVLPKGHLDGMIVE